MEDGRTDGREKELSGNGWQRREIQKRCKFANFKFEEDVYINRRGVILLTDNAQTALTDSKCHIFRGRPPCFKRTLGVWRPANSRSGKILAQNGDHRMTPPN